MNGMHALAAARDIIREAEALNIPSIQWPDIPMLAAELMEAAKVSVPRFLTPGAVHNRESDLTHEPVLLIADQKANQVVLVYNESQDVQLRFDLQTGDTTLMLSEWDDVDASDVLENGENILARVEVIFS